MPDPIFTPFVSAIRGFVPRLGARERYRETRASAALHSERRSNSTNIPIDNHLPHLNGCGPGIATSPAMATRWWTAIRRHRVLLVVVATGISGGLIVEALTYHAWGLLLFVTAPLYLVDRMYRNGVSENDHRLLPFIESLDEGVCAVDSEGRVTQWNEALQAMLNCPREHALGQSLAAAVPTLRHTALTKAIDEAIAERSPRTLERVILPTKDGAASVLRVKILPQRRGVTLLWHDLTDGSRANSALLHSEERFALMESNISDGLWEWDLGRQQVRFSAQWRSIAGLTAEGAHGSPEDWFTRVHADDREALTQAIEASLSGRTARFDHEHRLRHEDGTYRHVACRGIVVRGASRRALRIAGSLTDVTDRVKAQGGAGSRDPLTGLHKRATFVEGLHQRLTALRQHRGSHFAVLFLDLDRFKVVNDSLGHPVGDELLVAASRRIESSLRDGDALARLGGDEFAVLLNELTDAGQANAIAFRIQESLSAPFSIGGREVFTSASIGIAFSAPHYGDAEEIMRDADTAMYHAKARGKARHELFEADMHAHALDRLSLESDLRCAIKSSDFEVHYQPIVSLASGSCAGFEALVRWKRQGKAVSPDKFIPIAEELGLIESLGAWVLGEACRSFATWQQRFPESGLECITVNVSTRQLVQQGFVHVVEEAVQKARLKPSALRLEITETTLMDSPHVAAAAIQELRNLGVKVYLDDFGTGYSSLSHLHKLPVDALKIDRSFVRSLLLPERPAIVESILALARTLDTGVVAEGVENEVQARELARLGCRHAQGFLFSPPVSAQAVEELLASGKPIGPPAQRCDSAESSREQAHAFSMPFEWPEELRTTSTSQDTRPTSSNPSDEACVESLTAMWASPHHDAA